MRILLIEDDVVTATLLKTRLAEDGYLVDHASEGRGGLALAARESYDIAIVDRMLPEIDGLAIVKAMREAGVRTPVLFLTARSGLDDRIEGLEGGGDDYLIKPFDFGELRARLHALGRRSPLASTTEQSARRRSGDGPHQARGAPLRKRDRAAGAGVQAARVPDAQRRQGRQPRDAPRESGTPSRTAGGPWSNVHRRLRSKIDRGFTDHLVETVRGEGYCLRAPGQAPEPGQGPAEPPP
jgi:two-component system OmpR family response regulator